LSGGVDSSVLAFLLGRAIGKKAYCIFVDNGLLRLNEPERVSRTFKKLKINIKVVKPRKGSSES